MSPRRHWLRSLLAPGAALLLVTAAHAQQGAAPPPAARPPLVPTQRPNLEKMEPAVRAQLSEMADTVDQLLAADTSAADLGEAYGYLGQLYVLYGLLDAAEPVLRNARALAANDFRWPYYLGFIYQQGRRLDEATAALEAALALRPEDVPTLLRLGEIEVDQGRLDGAEKRFRQVLEWIPTSPAAHAGLGRIFALRRDPRQAARELEVALEAQPEATALHYALALAYRDLGDMDQARQHLEKRGQAQVRFLDPLLDDLNQIGAGAGVHMVRGNRAYTQGNYPLAIEAYHKAVAADPDNLTARQALASSLAAAGQLAPALAEYTEILTRAPDDPIAHYNLGTIYALQGEQERAVKSFERALEISPDFADAEFNLASALARLDRFEESEKHFARALALNPEAPDVRLRWAAVLDELGRHEEAAGQLRAVLAADPENMEGKVKLGAVLFELGQADEARALLATAIPPQLDAPRRGRAELEVGRILAASGSLAEALPHLQTAAALMLDDPEAHLLLATTLGRNGQNEAALAELTKVLALDPGNQQALLGRATALILAERFPEARSALEDAVARVPGSVPIAHLLARLLATCPDASVRDGERALALARKVFAAVPLQDYGETIAMALAELGRFDEALYLQQGLIGEAQKAGAAELLPGMRHRLELYQNHQPARAPWLDGRP